MSNMSSEGSLTTSSSSKIRQFGLYRTIDARTEEFLKLSKKRQLRQGCACAVVSTLITVTVVVSVLLVYEYGINSTWSPSHIKGWFGLMNGTNSMPFEEKFAQSNVNFDRATIKLLPIIIKALKQNRYLEKIIYDYTSLSPEYEGKSATEVPIKRNIFTDLKSMKPPSSRLYAIAYKTSPMAFTRNVTRNQDYYTKLRKLRDYKRITNYVEKMINAKGYTKPLKNEDYYQPTETNTMKLRKPPTNHNANRIHQSKNHKINGTVQQHSKQLNVSPLKKKFLQTEITTNPPNNNLSKSKTAEQTNATICTCSSKLGNLLNKLQASVKQLLLDAKSTKLLQPCSRPDPEKENLPIRPVVIIAAPTSETPFTFKTNLNKIVHKPYINNYISKPIGSKTFDEYDNISVGHSKEETDVNIKKYILELSNLSSSNITSLNSTFNLVSTRKPQVLTILPVMKLPSREGKIYSSTTHIPNNANTIENYIQLTELKGRPKKTIFRNYIIFPVIESELKNNQHINWPLFKPNFHYKDTIKVNSDSKPSITTVTDDDYNEEKITMKYLKDDIKELDVEHSSESSLKVNIEIGKTIDDDKLNDTILFVKQNMSQTTEEVINTTIVSEENITLQMKALEKKSSSDTKTDHDFESSDIAAPRPENITSILHNPLQDEGGILEDDSYKVTPDEDFYDDTSPMPTSNVTKISQSFTFEKNHGIQSMLPQNRPTYLKIQRSDWKHKESDYDRIK